MSKEKSYLTVKELANVMGISRIAVFKKIKKGQIPAEKVGRNYIIRKSAVGDVGYREPSYELRKEIDKGVSKVVKEYGETLKLLGKE